MPDDNPLAVVLTETIRDLADARRKIDALKRLGACRLDYLNWLTTHCATTTARGWRRLNEQLEQPGDWDALLVRARVDILDNWRTELDRREDARAKVAA